jgi:DNA-binding HxlR family transcriptional regulator
MRKNEPAGAYPGRARRAAPAGCPLAAAFAAVGGKWKLTILYWLSRDEHHFSGLLRRVAPISHKVLTEQLRELEAEGLVLREATAPVPAPVRYRLSAYGETVLPLVEAARVWGEATLPRAAGAGPSTCAMASASPIAPAYAVASAAR